MNAVRRRTLHYLWQLLGFCVALALIAAYGSFAQ